MVLDWDFYYDSWLIDKIPDFIDITIEEHPNGYHISPPELTCYFGANPIYLYGKGKLLEEVLYSPLGFAVYPEFLQKPGFDFVDEVSFSVSYDKKYDFNDVNVESKYVGYVNAKRYINGILSNIYKTNGDYVGMQTPSTDIRKANGEDYNLIQKGISDIATYSSVDEMKNDGCSFYCSMGIEKNRSRLVDEINIVEFDVKSPGAVVQVPGLYGRVVFTRYSYIILPLYVKDLLKRDFFQIFFTIEKDFRTGTVLEIGATHNSEGLNYGLKISIETDSIGLVLNDGNLNIFNFVHNLDFSVPHKLMILKDNDNVIVSADGKIIGHEQKNGLGNILFKNDSVPYISRDSSINKSIWTGDIEDFAIYIEKISDEKLKKYTIDDIPLLSRNTTNENIFKNVPVILSYDLTYSKPSRVFLSNFFGSKFKNIYTINKNDEVEKANDENGLILDNKSFIIKNGYKLDNVTTYEKRYGFDFSVGTNIRALKKITSDSHIPLKVHMKFKIPEWWDKKEKYHMRLMLRPISKLFTYNYEKLKTENIHLL